jgi:hypothetical protein
LPENQISKHSLPNEILHTSDEEAKSEASPENKVDSQSMPAQTRKNQVQNTVTAPKYDKSNQNATVKALQLMTDASKNNTSTIRVPNLIIPISVLYVEKPF